MKVYLRQLHYAVGLAAVLMIGLASCKEDAKRLEVYHEVHQAEELDCDMCHEEVDVSAMTATTPSSEICEVCHAETPPPTHDAAWMVQHGEESVFGSGMCDYCHKPSKCDLCHQVTEPKDHNTTFWRRRGHGLEAGWERDRCMVCHQEDFCVRCHEGTEPTSHNALWAGRQNSHCAYCHFPVTGDDNCGVCHNSTPVLEEHLSRLSTLSFHNPGVPCMDCHSPGKGLRHFVTEIDCEVCHLL